jgi:formate hydrogenlyase subunit 3/multisubunit Na+/H+ antiporter MnhD subunit
MNFLTGIPPHNLLVAIVALVIMVLIGAFGGYLYPPLVRPFALLMSLGTILLAAVGFSLPSAQQWQLMDGFGIFLQLDNLGSYFLLTNGLVTLAVLLYCWASQRTAFFYAQLMVLHVGLNAAFLSADLISLYVCLEVVGLASFLLIIYPRQAASSWIGLRYLFVTNTGLLFYLIGVILVYQATNSLNFQGLATAPDEAIALIFLGLLIKGEIFLSGLWSPQTSNIASAPVAALLSGVVVTAGILPLLRFAPLSEQLGTMVWGLAIATALLGIGLGIFARDSRRILAYSTISQMGFILVAPAVGGVYALTHGLAKACLFLLVGSLPEQDLDKLQAQPISYKLWLPIVLASSSIIGLPLLAGFEAKTLTLQTLNVEQLPWTAIAMNLAGGGTAIILGKFIFLTPSFQNKLDLGSSPWGLVLAVVLLLGALTLGNLIYPAAFSWGNGLKATASFLVGSAIYWWGLRKIHWQPPDWGERLDHLIGSMALMLTLLLGWILI